MSDDLLEVEAGLRELNSLLLAEETLATTLERVATVATRCVTGGDGASIMLLRGSAPYTAYATAPRVRVVDERQFERQEGPSIEALKTGDVQILGHSDDARWPDLEAVAAACGVRSMMCVPLMVGSEVVGALNVYARQERVFGPDGAAAVLLLAGQAAVSVANAKAHEECMSRIEQLQEALDSRVVIEQAKGILMERHRIGEGDAFARLRSSSQRANQKLRAVAAEVVASVTA